MRRNIARSLWLSCLLCLLIPATYTFAAKQTSGNLLANLRPQHPRLLAHDDDFARIRQLAQSDPLVKQWVARLRRIAQDMLELPASTYNKSDGKRLLTESRTVEGRALILSMMHRIEPNPRYVQRVWADMQAAAAFPDWNAPGHFLDTAEMTFGFAIAYDWLYDEWTPQQRQVMRDAMIKHGLEPGLECYRTGYWWTKSTSNWNQVCNSGMTAGALAIADEQPQLAGEIIRNVLDSLPIAMAYYAPDGGYEEGPGYWSYGTRFNVYILCMLQSALGSDFGLSEAPGFAETAGFPMQMTGPSGKSFNFADATEASSVSATHLYFAKRFNQPAYALAALPQCRGNVYELLFYDPDILKQTDASAPLPLDVLYQRIGVLAMRSSWSDPDALFVAAKGGENGKSHGQLDLGTFVLDADGERWFLDLGPDDYNLPDYFKSQSGDLRWTYYRCRAEGHNTLVIGPPINEEQIVTAVAQVKLDSQPQQAVAQIDLSKAYAQADGAQRRITLSRPSDGQPSVEVQDRIINHSPQPVWWFSHTRAAIELSEDGRTATLKQDGKTLRVELIQPELVKGGMAMFTVMEARPLPGSINPPGQNPNNGAELINPSEPGGDRVRSGVTPEFGEPNPDKAVRKLTIELKDVSSTNIVVRFTPLGQ